MHAFRRYTRDPHRHSSAQPRLAGILPPALALLASLLTACSRTGTGDSLGSLGFQDESQFIVHSIVTDLAAMGLHAGSAPPAPLALPKVRVSEPEDSPLGSPVYEIRVSGKPSLTARLNVDRPIWDPSLYTHFAASLFPSATAASPPPSTNAIPNLMRELTRFDVGSIEAANRSVSAELERAFLAPVAHERAALVLGVFGLREASGDFFDTRPTLCRMTAHLAVALHLRARTTPSPEGRVATVLLLTLMGNQKDALAALSDLPPGDDTAPWSRGLRARITGDYRPLGQAGNSLTPLESVCRFEALCRTFETSEAWRQTPDRELQARADYCRLANSHRRPVQLGHQLSQLCLSLELQEAITVLREARGWTGTGTPDWALLRDEPGPCVGSAANGAREIRVIGWGHWAQFLQRHLCHTVKEEFRFLNDSWGVPDTAAEFAGQANSMFQGLTLYPFVHLANATTQESRNEAAAACAQRVRRSPQWVGPGTWGLIYDPARNLQADLPADLRDISEWHKHNPPPFTAHLVQHRRNHMSFLHRPGAKPHIEALHARAPFDPDAARAWLHVHHGNLGANAPVEALEEAFAPVLDYSVPEMVRVARLATNNPATYEKYMRRAASLAGVHYFRLGEYFSQRNNIEQAAACYEKGVSECTDAVAVANNSAWLVRYYFDHNRQAEAEALAEQSADTYSYAGLATKGNLLFWQHRYAESLQYFKRIEERYKAPVAVVGWWADYRGQTNDPQYDAEVEKRLKTLFPRGVETVTLQSLRGRPKEGILIAGENDLVRQAGLKKGDIIVALQGRRVYDMPQYIYARMQLQQPAMTLICWDGRQYVERTCSPPDHRFGVPFESYYRER